MSTLPVPRKILDQHVIVLGKTRSGKSSTLRVCVEDALTHDERVCVVTPKDDWWGLKSSADGKKAGFPVVIFGGEHADVPINGHSGRHVAELIATGNRPCIITLSEFTVADRTRFFIDFAEMLFKLNRGMLHLVLDECHNFAPQGKVYDFEGGKQLHWANRLASEGSGRGIILMSASQRPQKVHKDYLTSHETLIAKRVIHKLDRDAVKDWIDGCGDPEKGKEVIASLANMQRPEAWVWSPEIGFGPKFVTFPMFSTYDSFKPQASRARRLKGWASVDLKEVTAKLEAVVEEHKKKDPAELQKQVRALTADKAKLEQQLTAAQAKPAAPDKAELSAKQERAIARAATTAKIEGYADAMKTAASMMAGLREKVSPLRGQLDTLLTDVATIEAWSKREGKKPTALAPVTRDDVEKAVQQSGSPTPLAAKRPPSPAPGAATTVRRNPSPAASGDGTLTPMQQSILNAIGWAHSIGNPAPTRVIVAFLAGSSPKSSTFEKYISQLRNAGLVTFPQPGSFALTEEGRAKAVIAEAGYTHEDIMAGIGQKLTPSQMAILRAATAAYPQDLAREDLAANAGMSATSSTFEKYVSQLSSLGVLAKSGPGRVMAAQVLFP